MARFIRFDCEHCGEPEIGLRPCPVCEKGFCDHCYYCIFIRNLAGDLVCPECIEDEKEEMSNE